MLRRGLIISKVMYIKRKDEIKEQKVLSYIYMKWETMIMEIIHVIM